VKGIKVFKVPKGMPGTVYGRSMHIYGRFRLRQLFMEFADGTRRLASTSYAITVLSLGELDGCEIVVTRMHSRRADVATMMLYLRQWLLSEPGRILHMIEDTNRLRRQEELDDSASTRVVTAPFEDNAGSAQTSPQQAAIDRDHLPQEVLGQYLESCPALDTKIFDIEIKDISMHRWRYALVLQAYHELALAHPEVEVDPEENLAIQDSGWLQILTERNQSESE
jgi:hypothetical protein